MTNGSRHARFAANAGQGRDRGRNELMDRQRGRRLDAMTEPVSIHPGDARAGTGVPAGSSSPPGPPRSKVRFLRRIGGAQSWTAMVWLWLIYAMNANMRNWIQVVQPAVVEEFHISASAIGVYSGVLTMGLGVAAICMAPWVDRGGHGWARKYRHVAVVATYLVFSLLTGVMPLTIVFGAVFALQMIKNFASGVGETIEVTTIAEWWPLERRGFAQGLHHTAFPWGTLLGGLGVTGVYAIFGSGNWRFVFLLLPLVVIPAFAGYWFFATPVNYSRFIEDTRARGLTPPLVAGDHGATVHAAPGAFRRALANPNVLVSSICAGLANLGYMALSFWLPLYLAFIAHFDLALVATYSVLFTITGGLGQIVWGSISDRFGRKFSLVVMFLWLVVAFLLFRYIGASIGVMVLVQLFAGMATNGVYPVLYAMASDSSEKGAIAIGNGLNMGGLIIAGFGPILVGWLIGLGGGYSSPTGYMVSLYVLAGTMLLTAVLIALFTRETSGRFRHLDRALVSVEACLKGDVVR
jgi:MFS family permease